MFCFVLCVGVCLCLFVCLGVLVVFVVCIDISCSLFTNPCESGYTLLIG